MLVFVPLHDDQALPSFFEKFSVKSKCDCVIGWNSSAWNQIVMERVENREWEMENVYRTESNEFVESFYGYSLITKIQDEGTPASCDTRTPNRHHITNVLIDHMVAKFRTFSAGNHRSAWCSAPRATPDSRSSRWFSSNGPGIWTRDEGRGRVSDLILILVLSSKLINDL